MEQGIRENCGVLLEVKWKENYCGPQAERLVPVYNKAIVLGLHTFLRDKFSMRVSKQW
jgi:hypothetical protein